MMQVVSASIARIRIILGEQRATIGHQPAWHSTTVLVSQVRLEQANALCKSDGLVDKLRWPTIASKRIHP